jgi:O-methyltransferase
MTSYRPIDRLPPLTAEERDLVERFTRLYYSRWDHGVPGGRGTVSIGWLGHLTQKCPLDLWVFQEILVETTPDVIIECGTCLGGSALFLASICELLGRGRVVSIDVAEVPGRPVHPRLEYVLGSSADPEVIRRATAGVRPGERVMVILDSDHRRDHVLAELRALADWVTPGCYLIVEDTSVNGHPLAPEYGPGPLEALEAFLPGRGDFELDETRERFLLTLNPRGHLRRTAPADPRALLPPAGRRRLDQLIDQLIDLHRVGEDDGTRFPGPAPADLAGRRAARLEGRDWPLHAETMVGRRRLEQLAAAVLGAVAEGVPGDVFEAGVWRGGASILARAALQEAGVEDRVVWVADSFAGLPPPDPERYPADAGDRHYQDPFLRVPRAEVERAFARHGLLDRQVRFLEGWFEQTLPAAPVERLAVLRLDGDMYGSTIVALDALYHRVSPGGFVIVDDYGAVPGCRQAVDDFRARHAIAAPLVPVDWAGVFWRVPRGGGA